MAKKRKKREPLGEVVKDLKIEEGPPNCYGQKEAFCKPELCGKWFDSCGASTVQKFVSTSEA